MWSAPKRPPVSRDDDPTGPEADAGAPTCPLCGDELRIVERVGSRWWRCEGEDHSYSREVGK